MTNTTLNNVVALDKFSALTEDEMMLVEGGLFPIIIGGIVISKGVVIGVGAVAAGLGIGYLVNR
ncbi:bacteriocin [Pseudolactococcus reticulitermitis]|uniref:Class IIb bacteriocin, lactobin A/cerein 7B family n=1 Tax=Pseudolactococcus reticulitermitis TaxID=2025039 RepID=A0A224XC08_9LACT|nr:bacteriocin [Lactococcus reticulitermitis]GAX47684.1 hypothetical protein RsY01_1285 [Lactococcus reticulitermitis]